MDDMVLARFRSTTRAGIWYSVVLNRATGELRCEGCPGFGRWRRCWHVRAVAERWEGVPGRKRVETWVSQMRQRAIGRALGVDEKTVRNDLDAEKSAVAPGEPKQIAGQGHDVAEYSASDPAWFQDPDVDPAKLAKTQAKRIQKEVA